MARKTRLKDPKSKPKPKPVTTVTVDPEVWEQALATVRTRELPKSAIQIIGPHDVIVWNHSGPWPRRKP